MIIPSHCALALRHAFHAFRTRATHVVEFRPIGIKDRLLQSAPNLDRRDQTGYRGGDGNGRLGRWENRNCGAAHSNYPIRLVCRPITPRLITTAVPHVRWRIARFRRIVQSNLACQLRTQRAERLDLRVLLAEDPSRSANSRRAAHDRLPSTERALIPSWRFPFREFQIATRAVGLSRFDRNDNHSDETVHSTEVELHATFV
jgi:hypothetical protein